MSQERIESFRSDDIGDNTLRIRILVAICPLDLKSLFFEQALIVGHEFRQPLERLGVFQCEFLHCEISRADKQGSSNDTKGP